MLDHINRIKSLHDQLSEMCVQYDDKELAMTLLASLHESYNPLITVLDAVGEDKLTFEKVKGMLLNNADRVSVTKKDEDAYNVHRPYKGKGFKPKERNDNNNQGSFRGTCYSCKKRGHFARDCPQHKNNNPSNPNKGKGSINCAEEESYDQEDVDEIALLTTGNENQSGWIIDSGATQHMTYERDNLSEYVEFKRPCKVNLGDDRVVLAYGKGTYRLSTDLNGSGQKIALKNVLYLPELKRNLLSVQTMSKLGATVVFKEDECRISKDSKLIGIGTMYGKLYMLKVISEEYVNVMKKNNPNKELWHCRFGHLGMDNISKLLNENMVEGMSNARNTDMSDVCEACVQGKQHRTPYPKKSSNKATELFKTVHSDVCGPMNVKSFGKSQYFVTFIDEYSRYTEVYFLKSKDEVLEKFKQYVNQVEKLGKRVKNLRSDNGGEYCSRVFDDYLKAKGITHQTTVPHRPEQNGIAERMNRTLVEAAHSMMFHAGMPKEFWAEAIHTAAYVHNRSPTRSLKEVTPFQRMYGQKPDVSNLRVFGCIAFKHIPDAT